MIMTVRRQAGAPRSMAAMSRQPAGGAARGARRRWRAPGRGAARGGGRSARAGNGSGRARPPSPSYAASPSPAGAAAAAGGSFCRKMLVALDPRTASSEGWKREMIVGRMIYFILAS